MNILKGIPARMDIESARKPVIDQDGRVHPLRARGLVGDASVNEAGLLELRGITCIRGHRTLFTDLTRSIHAGDLVRVQGANGAGKTSLLRLLCGLLEPTAGEVLWRGRRVRDLREEYGRELVYLGHAAALKDDLSPLENLRASVTLAGHLVTDVAAATALAQAGLRGHERTPSRRLSQGQRRRAALARLALPGSQAALWILDEPFNALDTTATGWLAGLIRGQLQRGGLVVLTSHQSGGPDDVPGSVLAL